METGNGTGAGNPAGTKECRRCGEVKPAERFSGHVRTSDGLQSWCRECAKEFTALSSKWKDIGGARCCRVCREIKPKNGDYFTPDTSLKGGFRTVCRECERRQEEGAGTAQECGQSVTEPSGVREAGTGGGLALFTSRELMDELKRRGYAGELRKSVIVRI